MESKRIQYVPVSLATKKQMAHFSESSDALMFNRGVDSLVRRIDDYILHDNCEVVSPVGDWKIPAFLTLPDMKEVPTPTPEEVAATPPMNRNDYRYDRRRPWVDYVDNLLSEKFPDMYKGVGSVDGLREEQWYIWANIFYKNGGYGAPGFYKVYWLNGPEMNWQFDGKLLARTAYLVSVCWSDNIGAYAGSRPPEDRDV